jgi:cell division protein FtsB
MRIRRSVARVFSAMVLPAITAAVVAYFGTYAIWGARGYYALHDTQVKLVAEQNRYAQAKDARERLQHRISLLGEGKADPDLVEELARSELMDGAPGQVAVPRDSH